MSTPAAPAPSAARVWIALGAVYVIWSTTYLGIRVTNDTLPPLLAAAVRFLVAGSVVYAIAVRRGDREGDRPGRAQWRAAAIGGTLLIFLGNGGVVWAERTVPSGIVALIIATVPLWMAVIDRLVYRRRQPLPVIAGLILGFVGAAALVGESVLGHVDPGGLLVAVGATICWASGSLYARRAALPLRPFVAAGMEMLTAGVLFVAAGAIAGEFGRLDAGAFSRASVLALAYLIVFGSWIGFTSYLWLLRNTRTSLVSTYAYVTPVGAVALGAIVLHETVTARTVFAGGLIVVAVAIIISAGARQQASHAGEERGPQVEPEIPFQGLGRTEEDLLAEHRPGELQPDG
ncbi:MAG: EamA family transporter [Actinobacteria bacterium]|nr:EamA family transporter [Actinomycetota bacterium]